MFFGTIVLADYVMTTPCARQEPNGPYEKIAKQKANKQQESNLTNQQDEKSDNEKRVALWPCRGAPKLDKPHVFKRGQQVPVETQSNNMHAGYIEVNLFRGDQVHQALAPTKSGSGFSRAGTTVTIPSDFPACTAKDNCFLQFYFHSKEPRNYVTCADFVLEDDVAEKATGLNDCADDPKKRVQTMTSTLKVKLDPKAPKTVMKPIKVGDDGKFYDEVSTNYEAYMGQSDTPPTSATMMWDLTLPGEIGKEAVKMNLMTEQEAKLRKDFRKVIVSLTQVAEGYVRTYQAAEASKLKAMTTKDQMMEDKGRQHDNGANIPAKIGAYNASLFYKPTTGDDYKSPVQMQILSDPGKREDKTTYIDLVGPCLKSVYDAVMRLEKTNVDARIADKKAKNGDADAEKEKIKAICKQQMGTESSDDQKNNDKNNAPVQKTNPDDEEQYEMEAPQEPALSAPVAPAPIGEVPGSDYSPKPATPKPATPKAPMSVKPAPEAPISPISASTDAAEDSYYSSSYTTGTSVLITMLILAQ